MRIAQSDIQKFKIGAHLLQALLIFIALCLTISVMVKDGETGGATKYFFAMCFISFPAIVYLVGVPMWTRARKFSSAYAFLAVDAVFMILWFAAFVSVAVWNSHGIIEGAKAKKVSDDDRDCKTFLYGSEAKCNHSKASVGIGAVVFIFFIVSTAISSYYMFKYLREGAMPYESQEMDPHYTSGESAKDNAWSTEIEQDDDDDRHTERGGRQEEDEYALLNSTDTDQGRHPGRPLSWGEDRNAYAPGPGYADYRDPSDVLSPGGYEEYRREAAGSVEPRPAGPGGSGYSFAK